MSCGVLNLTPKDGGIDPVAFWEHSLGCALVCRHFARKISYPDPGKAYLAGLLHDLGIIVNLWTCRKNSAAAFELARTEGIPLHEAEQSVLGFTHCESGRLLAETLGTLRRTSPLSSRFTITAQESHDHAGPGRRR